MTPGRALFSANGSIMRCAAAMRRIQRSDLIDTRGNISAASTLTPLASVDNAHERFSVQFRMVAMLFIIFDIETVFLIPWGAIYWNGGLEGGPGTGFLLAEMAVFMFVLAVGYVYVWKRGALQWD